MKLYGHPVSTCTRKVLMTLAETNTPYEMVVVDFAKGEHKQEPHLSRQPFGQVPAIDDDGVQLYESRAIARYINDKAKGKLVPSDLVGRARMEQWISVETSNFSPHAMKYVYNEFFKRPQSDEVMANAEKQVDVALSVMDAQLGKHPFIAGDEFTLADVCFMPYLEYGMKTKLKGVVEKYPYVMAWWKRVSERPSWRKVSGNA